MEELVVTENVSSAPKTDPQPEGWGFQNLVSGHHMQMQPQGRNVHSAWTSQEVPPGAARTLRKKLDASQSLEVRA